jgi:carbonic anhydrase
MFIVFITLFDSIEDETERFNAFVEINAKEQVYDLSKTSIVQAAWKNGQDLSIHGWVYGLNSGFVTDLKSISVQIKN